MSRLFAAFIGLVFLGCGGSLPGAEPGGTPESRAVVSDADGSVVHLVRDEGALKARIDAAPGEVWPHLVAVYAGIGLDATVLSSHDPRTRHLEVVNHRARRLAGQPISRFLSCGDAMGMPNAMSGRVHINLKSWLEPDGAGTRLSTRFGARVHSSGATSNTLECASIGTLERQIVERLHQRLLEANR